MIPDESDQINRPSRPDFRCDDRSGLCDAVRILQRAVVDLEERLSRLEEGTEFFEEVVDPDKE